MKIRADILKEIDHLKASVNRLQDIVGIETNLEYISKSYLADNIESLQGFMDEKIDFILNRDTIDKNKIENSLKYFYNKLKIELPEIEYVEDIKGHNTNIFSTGHVNSLYRLLVGIDIDIKKINRLSPIPIDAGGKLAILRKVVPHLKKKGCLENLFLFLDIDKTMLPFYLRSKISEDIDNYLNLIESGLLTIISDGRKLIVVKKPKIIFDNEDVEIEFKSESYGYIEKVFISMKTIEDIKNNTYSTERFLSESNEEVKSLIIRKMQEFHGEDSFYMFMKGLLEEVDTYVDKKEDEFLEGTTRGMNIGVYTLFKKDKISFVRCYCPSTDRMFFLGVNSEYNNAKDAIASLYQVPGGLEKDILYIQRQGEIFSTVFTEEGIRKIKESNYSIWAPAQITGNEYFKKLRYEY